MPRPRELAVCQPPSDVFAHFKLVNCVSTLRLELARERTLRRFVTERYAHLLTSYDAAAWELMRHGIKVPEVLP